jgi:hypothetical protein
MAAGALTGGGIYIAQQGGGGGGPGPGEANFWVDTNGGSCTRQSPAGTYVDAQACSSFNTAYQAASKGDLVLVRAGSYGNQVIARDAGISTGPYSTLPDGSEVTFRADEGANVVLSAIDTSGGFAEGDCDPPNEENCRDSRTSTWFTTDHFTIEDMTIGIYSFNLVRDVHLINVTSDGENFLDHSQYFSIQDSDFSFPVYRNDGASDAFEWGEGMDWVLVENNDIHDVLTDTCTDGCHPDAVSINNFMGNCGQQGPVEFKRNRFWNNDIINWRGGCDNMLIENNMFGASNHSFSLQFHGDNATIRFNVIQGDYQNTGTGESDGQRWIGNIGPTAGTACPNPSSSGVVAEYNVWGSNRPVTCGGGANNFANGNFNSFFTSVGEPPNFHLNAGTTPVNFVPTSVTGGCPSTDFDQQSRPIDTNCDAGVDERDD